MQTLLRAHCFDGSKTGTEDVLKKESQPQQKSISEENNSFDFSTHLQQQETKINCIKKNDAAQGDCECSTEDSHTLREQLEEEQEQESKPFSRTFQHNCLEFKLVSSDIRSPFTGAEE
ncbi:hypothetical protein RUM44_012570 [Polyplax serrata]|uniref:Uncharacterized protein n=1 Tax=Polyplax serrata TaxID=468196 RepID=A0ABR1BFW3_POLSC